MKGCRITFTKKFSYLFNVLIRNNTCSATSLLLIHICLLENQRLQIMLILTGLSFALSGALMMSRKRNRKYTPRGIFYC